MAAFRTPIVVFRDYKKDPENFVWIKLEIPKLKKACLSNDASNAEVFIQTFPNDRSFSLEVKVKGEKDTFKYSVTKLPEKIIPDKSVTKVKDGAVIVKLCKVSPGIWGEQLAHGLDLEPVQEDN